MYQHTQNYLRYECVVIYILPTFYIPQDRLKTILNELIELASLIQTRTKKCVFLRSHESGFSAFWKQALHVLLN